MITVLECSLLGMNLKSPAILGSGTITERKESIIEALKSGAGGAVTRTLRLNPRRELFVPNVFTEGDEYMLNADNQNLTPWNYWVKNVKEIERYGRLGVSLSARVPSDCKEIAAAFEENIPPSFYEVNFSCPHSAVLYGKIPYRNAIQALRYLKEVTHKPVLLKFSVSNLDFTKLKKIEEENLADGYVISNSIGPGLRIDIETGKPVLKSIFGGVSGKAIKSLVLAAIYQLRKETGKPIIGVGGIYTGSDVVEYLLAGASATEVYTAAHVKGMGVFNSINNEVEAILKRTGKGLNDFILHK